jgi:hypothetical protein
MIPKGIEWLREPEGATEQEIAEVEIAVGHVFPDDYRQFARLYAGGIPYSRTNFEFRETNGRVFHAGAPFYLSFRKGAEYELLDALAGC